MEFIYINEHYVVDTMCRYLLIRQVRANQSVMWVAYDSASIQLCRGALEECKSACLQHCERGGRPVRSIGIIEALWKRALESKAICQQQLNQRQSGCHRGLSDER